jgi:F-type H+-transporting ATPase subunit delta
MNYSAIAVRYSKALFALAEEKGILEDVQKDIALIKSVCESEPEFIRFIEFPVIASTKKFEVLSLIFSDKITGTSLEFLKLLAKNRRESFLHQITLDFQSQYKIKKGIKTITFTSVSEITDSVRKNIRNLLKNKYGSEIEILEQTNENLIGGFVLRIDDEQYDASVAKQLEKIKRSFKS